MNHTHFNLVGRKKKGLLILVSIAVLLLFINGSFLSNSTIQSIGEQNRDPTSDLIINELKIAANEPNGKPLLVSQYANFTESYVGSNLPSNVSFILQKDWVAQNINVSFEGVSQKKDRVINGTFDSEYHGWTYKSNVPDEYIGREWQDLYGNPAGSILIEINKYSYVEGDYGYYEQNITIQEELSSDKLAVLSFDYYCDKTPENISAYLAIKMGNSEKNITFDFPTSIQLNSWETLTMVYDPEEFHGQMLPGNVTARVGVYSHGPITVIGGNPIFRIDNLKFDLWTMPNQMNMVVIQDTEFNSNHTYVNSTYGKGYYYNATERSYSTNKEVIFTISQNITGIDDFDIAIITINANLLKRINSSISGLDGSLYTTGIPMIWQTELVITIPSDYKNSRAEITKPADWNITQILDGFDVDRIESCPGTDPGSVEFTIPNGVFDQALWKIDATSSNYISNGSLVAWNGSAFNEESSITLGDTFQINATLNDTIPFASTQANCTIEYPNGTIFWQKSKTLGSYNINFGNLTVGFNMSVGNYQTIIEWTNNQSQSDRDKVGFMEFGFNVWHQTNLTALNSEETKVSGEPYLMKVEFRDYDFNESIDFATITFNSTYSASGTMAYLGSGIYGFDIVLSGLSAGDYYYSFNASKNNYENQSIINLIHLEIITQPLALETPSVVINADANSYAICRINVTGALSGTLLTGPVNVTTNWIKNYIVTDNGSGIVKLNLSTDHIPIQGIPETFTVTIFANKTNYGSTSGFISITVHPISTIVNVNKTLVDVYLNGSFDLRVNYTEEVSSNLIDEAILNVTWDSIYSILPDSDSFIISFSTTNLSVATHAILLQLNHPGYETGFYSVYVNVLPKTTSVSIFLNQEDKTSDSSLAISGDQSLNITIKYKDAITDSFIPGAIVELNGSSISETLTEIGQQYSIIFNPGDIPIGIHFLSITAQKEYYNINPSIIKITINPIPSIVNVNETIINVILNSSFYLSVNYTEEGSSNVISGALLNVSWVSSYDIIPDGNGFIVNFSTTNLSLITYTIVFQLNHPRYEAGFQSVYVNVQPKTTSLNIFLNQEDKSSDRSLSILGNEVLNITLMYMDTTAGSFISGAGVELNGSGISKTLTEIGQQYFLIFNPGELNVGIHFLSITAQKANYNFVPSILKITVEQIEVYLENIGFNGTRQLSAGDSFLISIILTEENTGNLIEDSVVTFSGLTYLDEVLTNKGNGLYEVEIKAPSNAKGSYTIDLTVKINGNLYKERYDFSIDVFVLQPPPPNYLVVIVLSVLIPVIGALSVLSLRSYVLIPRKRKKERLFMNTIQVFKDVKNIQALMLIQKESGMPFFTKNISEFDFEDNFLISGFIQAITIFGRQMIKGDDLTEDKKIKHKEPYAKNIAELDFKFFRILICDHLSLRSVLIIREESSKRIRKQLYLLTVAIEAKLGEKIRKFKGRIDGIESKIEILLNEFLFLYFNEPFKLIDDAGYMRFLKKGGELHSIEPRILNVIISITKINKEFTLNRIIEEIDEKDIDKIYGGIHTLIQRNIIIPATQESDDAHPLLGGLK